MFSFRRVRRVCFIVLITFVYFFQRVVEGDLGASFIIGSAHTKLDIKVDTQAHKHTPSNDQLAWTLIEWMAKDK